MATGWFKKKDKKDPPSDGKTTAPAGQPVATMSAKGVSIGKLLTEDLILVRPPAADKAQLMEQLVAKLCAVKGLGDPAPLLKKVLEREQGISTTLDTGLSLPHARVDGVSEISTILGLLPEGLPDPKQPELTIRAMFLFFSPNRQDAFTRHLHLLRTVSALFQPAFIDQLLACPGPGQVLQLVRKTEA